LGAPGIRKVIESGAGVRGGPALVLTPDEEAVIRLMRRTPYGKVVTTMRAGQITQMQREETLLPPSLQQRRSSPKDGQS